MIGHGEGESHQSEASAGRRTCCSKATGRSRASSTRWSTHQATRGRCGRHFIASLEALGPEELQERFARADQYLRDAGVYYRVYDRDGANEREWPLAHVPLLVDEAEWADISAGLIAARRAVRGDLRRHLWPEPAGGGGAAAARPDRVEPGISASLRRHPAGRRAFPAFLRLRARPRARMARWWVLGDRMQAASGAGFALENRVATTRALSDIYGEMHVHRLAGFFRRFRDALTGMAGEPAGRVGDPDARAAQRDLLRARLHRPLSRHHAARRRGPDRHRRPADGAHRVGAEAGQRAVAAARRRLRRSAGAARRIRASARRAWPKPSGRAR